MKAAIILLSTLGQTIHGDSTNPSPTFHQTAALYTADDHLYYADLWVGKPFRQRQTMMIDTTSRFTSVPCTGCTNCGKDVHMDKALDVSLSKTFQQLDCESCLFGECKTGSEQCSLEHAYGSGTAWTGYEVKDSAYVGGWHDTAEDCLHGKDVFRAESFSFWLNFFCQTTQSGAFTTRTIDGVLGMSNEDGSYWRQMHDTGIVEKKKFGLCVPGVITLGGTDPRLNLTPMVYVKNSSPSGPSYTLELQNIYFLRWNVNLKYDVPIGSYNEIKDTITNIDVADDLLGFRETIIDTSSTRSYLPQKIFDKFSAGYAKQDVNTPYKPEGQGLNGNQRRNMPTILYQFKGYGNEKLGDDPNSIPGLAGDLDPNNRYDVIIAARHINYFDEPDALLQFQEEGKNVLSAQMLGGYNVLFDMEDDTIGFAQSECNYDKLMGLESDAHGGIIEPPSKDNTKAKGNVVETNVDTWDDDTTSQNLGFNRNKDNQNQEPSTHSSSGAAVFFFGILIGVLSVLGWDHLQSRQKQMLRTLTSQQNEIETASDL